jgi:hypothetical protein
MKTSNNSNAMNLISGVLCLSRDDTTASTQQNWSTQSDTFASCHRSFVFDLVSTNDELLMRCHWLRFCKRALSLYN